MKKQNVLKKIIFMLMVFSVMFWENGYSATYVWTWTGNTSTNWSDAGNWSGGDPLYNYPGENTSDINDVVFDLNSSVNCILDKDISINNFTITIGYPQIFNLPSLYTLSITGDISIDDPLYSWNNTGTIILCGSTNQNITVTSSSGGFHFTNLIINKTGGNIILGNDINVDGTFDNQSSSSIQDNGYTIFINGNPLPIELISFTAESSNNTIILHWSTASEENNDYFVIERSSNCNNWYQLIQIPGAGNSQVPLYYSWIDTDPLLGISYYRLTQVDYDGQSEIFTPIAVNFFGRKSLIYPNPAQNQINLPDFGHIMDQQGKLIFVGNPGENNISFLPSGLYYVTINGITQPFIKE